MGTIRLEFRTVLAKAPAECWTWATSVDGISAELAPVMRMSTPKGVRNLLDLKPVMGKPLFRSWVYLFGIIPIDRSDLTLIELEPGRRFLEQSPMLSMKLWRHERTIDPVAGGASSVLTDRLEFEPRFLPGIVEKLIRTVFTRRHQILRQQLGGDQT